MNDGYEFEVPEEIKAWIEHQQERQRADSLIGRIAYVFENGKIRSATFLEAAIQFENIDSRRVDYTDISENCHVSTVFLNIDHGFNWDAFLKHPPILFETMIFGGELDGFQWRYATFGEAKRGHWLAVEAAREGRRPDPDMDVGEEGFWNWFKDFRDMFDE